MKENEGKLCHQHRRNEFIEMKSRPITSKINYEKRRREQVSDSEVKED